MTRKLLGPICIPWDEEANIARAYLETTKVWEPHVRWLGFMDHDCELLNRDWYARLKKAIEQHPQVGLWTCRSQLQHQGQRSQSLGILHDLNTRERVALAKGRAEQQGERVTILGITPPELISGMFFFVDTTLFLQIGHRLEPGMMGVDNNIHIACHKAGRPVGVIEAMVIWHRYGAIDPRSEERSKYPRAKLLPR